MKFITTYLYIELPTYIYAFRQAELDTHNILETEKRKLHIKGTFNEYLATHTITIDHTFLCTLHT